MKRKLQNIINTVLLIKKILKYEEFTIFLTPKLAPILRQHGHAHFTDQKLSAFYKEITTTIHCLRSIIDAFIANTGIMYEHYFHSHTSDLLSRLLRFQNCLKKLKKITPDPVCRLPVLPVLQIDNAHQDKFAKLHANQAAFKEKWKSYQSILEDNINLYDHAIQDFFSLQKSNFSFNKTTLLQLVNHDIINKRSAREEYLEFSSTYKLYFQSHHHLQKISILYQRFDSLMMKLINLQKKVISKINQPVILIDNSQKIIIPIPMVNYLPNVMPPQNDLQKETKNSENSNSYSRKQKRKHQRQRYQHQQERKHSCINAASYLLAIYFIPSMWIIYDQQIQTHRKLYKIWSGTPLKADWYFEGPEFRGGLIFRRSGTPLETDYCPEEAGCDLELHFEADHCPELHFEADH
ncbi:hypothetical protein RclHR1_09700001 [Rhizophagus clarus]|uniref:Uncharacterized protein n=1 Tax=Rhizophagus clarus TaxID=94130 RepID=A0A2Z6SJ28_9GLOM|nr:hypothetical protein RclHR1_09700001 [Rhizophagus clarus]